MNQCIRVVLILLFIVSAGGFTSESIAQRMDIPSSPNPVGSGARALGMGGAFIAVADDATAASWNPGGLIQLKRPEISVVGAWFHRIEENSFGTAPEASGDETVAESNLNYLSLSYPFNLFKRNMIISLNYQHLFDFTREWDFRLLQESGTAQMNRDFHYHQEGSLSAAGIAYCAQITPKLSMGMTLNIWNDDTGENKWKQVYEETLKGVNTESAYKRTAWDCYEFEGVNFNIGLLWNVTPNWTIGAVFKSPFTADIHHTAFESISENPEVMISDEELDMPMSYGIGVAWHPTDHLTISADIYRTEWDDFVLKDSDGQKTSVISGLPDSESDIDPTCQVRAGAEYLFLFPEKGFVIPLRGGIFYDPSPAEGRPDDFYGFSLGTGFAKSPYIFDIAYQYRFGRDVSEYLFTSFDFSQDVDEHTLYFSFIYHF